MNEEIKYLGGEVHRLIVKPGDTVVLMLPCSAPESTRAILKAQLEREFEGHRVFVLEAGLQIGVLGTEPE